MEPLKQVRTCFLSCQNLKQGTHPQVFAAMHSGNTDNVEQRTIHNFIHECIEVSIWSVKKNIGFSLV